MDNSRYDVIHTSEESRAGKYFVRILQEKQSKQLFIELYKTEGDQELNPLSIMVSVDGGYNCGPGPIRNIQFYVDAMRVAISLHSGSSRFLSTLPQWPLIKYLNGDEEATGWYSYIRSGSVNYSSASMNQNSKDSDLGSFQPDVIHLGDHDNVLDGPFINLDSGRFSDSATQSDREHISLYVYYAMDGDKLSELSWGESTRIHIGNLPKWNLARIEMNKYLPRGKSMVEHHESNSELRPYDYTDEALTWHEDNLPPMILLNRHSPISNPLYRRFKSMSHWINLKTISFAPGMNQGDKRMLAERIHAYLNSTHEKARDNRDVRHAIMHPNWIHVQDVLNQHLPNESQLSFIVKSGGTDPLSEVKVGDSGLAGRNGGWRYDGLLGSVTMILNPELEGETSRSISEVIYISHAGPMFLDYHSVELNPKELPDMSQPSVHDIRNYLMNVYASAQP